MLEQTTLEVIAVNDHRKCYRGDHTTVIVIMPFKRGGFCFVVNVVGINYGTAPSI